MLSRNTTAKLKMPPIGPSSNAALKSFSHPVRVEILSVLITTVVPYDSQILNEKIMKICQRVKLNSYAN